MKLLSPTQHKRLNELTGVLLLSLGLVILLSLVSYHAQDPSWDTAANARPLNLVGYLGSYLSDLLYQAFGVGAFLFPLLSFALAWHWILSEELQAGAVKIFGAVLFLMSLSAALSFLPWRMYGGQIRVGGVVGLALAKGLVDSLNLAGALLVTATCIVVSVYLVSTFTVSKLAGWVAVPAAWFARRRDAWRAWRARAHRRALEQAQARALARRAKKREQAAAPAAEHACSVGPRPRTHLPGRKSRPPPNPGMPASKRSPSVRSRISNRSRSPIPSRRPSSGLRRRPRLPPYLALARSSSSPIPNCSTKCPAAIPTTSRS